MDIRNLAPRAPPSVSAAMDQSEESLAEVDEPPEHPSSHASSTWAPAHISSVFGKAVPNVFQRRESLLTRQLQSEPEHTDEDDVVSTGPARTLSTHSAWSVGSTAELTSDDGHSVPSPSISPPLPPTDGTVCFPIPEKALPRELKIVDHDVAPVPKQTETRSEESVEAGLGRRRCISFACGGKAKVPPPTSAPAPPAELSPQSPARANSPPKRKCALKFVCPTRVGSDVKTGDKDIAVVKRPVSPPPPQRRPSAGVKAEGLRAHRGSDSTVTHASPRSVRKSPTATTTASTSNSPVVRTHTRKLSNDSDASTEATRFHEFATSDDEPEEWVQESTCHRSRLTVSDTLKKENVIRRACEEVEEEAVEEEEEEEAALDDEEDELDEEDEDDAGKVDDDEIDEEEEEEENDDDDDDGELSDEGFRTDDEHGFAASDSEGEESDEDWWRPGGASTAATSIDHLDRMVSQTRSTDVALASSIGSASSGRISPRASVSRRKHHRRRRDSNALPIQPNRTSTDLPDSTDFVCGTLDEDRPLEQAFLNSIKQREAAKHITRPQDIDPSFPTSDPELDEEDDEDLIDPQPSESENFMHGELDEVDGDLTARRRPSPRPRSRSITARSPAPQTRHRSPPPPKRAQIHAARSPPPPPRRVSTRSPPLPRKLFGHSPRPTRLSPPSNRATSPPNTRRASVVAAQHLDIAHHGFASRSNVTHTASLPRGGGFMLSRLNTLHLDDVDEASASGPTNIDSPALPKRGAIDIVKGLERKRQRRKERLYAKACAKAAAKGDKAYKVKPGKGAERMRELGLELQRYHGKGEHILSM